MAETPDFTDNEGTDEKHAPLSPSTSSSSSASEKKMLLHEATGSEKKTRKEGWELYMTPHSVVCLSQPVVVLVGGVAGACLLFLAFLSLFLHPHKITCALLAGLDSDNQTTPLLLL